MRNTRRLVLGIFLLLLGALVLFGCRAFEPEVLIVNKTPETYLIGAPAETTGGYFHFHVWWYGTDEDGTVTQFVWALTDTSVQDNETPEDEEDERFDPGDNISTLDIGHYTTRTDTVFDFSLNQGPVLAYSMTLHMVAVDDQGDFDRTPARLRFISNTLGNPRIKYERLKGDQWVTFANQDTIAFGEYLQIRWSGETPNIRSFSRELLLQRDTVPEGLPPEAPRDGLLGFKYRLPDVACDESSEDCWKPRQRDPSTGKLLSYFGDVRELTFRNDGSSEDISGRRLTAGVHQVLVNTIDLAGVEVPANKQALNVVVNYDPDTQLLSHEQDPLPHLTNVPAGTYSYTDDREYPYYTVFYPGALPGQPAQPAYTEEHPVPASGRVPDRAWVTFKALGRDDPRDLKIDPNYLVRYQSFYHAQALFNLGSPFDFEAIYSEAIAHRTEEWQPDVSLCDTCWSADTLSFEVGPFDYDYDMRTMDEWEKRDGTPPTFSFTGNYSPCVQAIEVLNFQEPSQVDITAPCSEDTVAATVDELYAMISTNPDTEHRRASLVSGFAYFYYKLDTEEVWLRRPLQLTDVDSVYGQMFGYKLWLHGQDYEEEPAVLPQDRVMSWRYQITYENDPSNLIKDGGGNDNLQTPTFRFYTASADSSIYVDEDGVWIFKVRFFVPYDLLLSGSEGYVQQLYTKYVTAGSDHPQEDADLAFALTTKQLGQTQATVIARDVSNCDWRPDNGEYHVYAGVRPPQLGPQGITPHYQRKCNQAFEREVRRLPLTTFGRRIESHTFTKRYLIKVLTNTGEIFPE
jgi:hypothetical protein